MHKSTRSQIHSFFLMGCIKRSKMGKRRLKILSLLTIKSELVKQLDFWWVRLQGENQEKSQSFKLILPSAYQ